MQSTYTSGELFHFVGFRSPDDHETNYKTLLKVLGDCWVSHPPHERNWGRTQAAIDCSKRLILEELIVPAVTCYADIPLDHLGLHARKYGMFGVSFRRDYLVKYGARPVFYIPFSRSDFLSPFGIEMLK